MSTTLNRKDGALPWLMLTGMLSARRCTRAGLQSRRRLGGAKALWAMKAAKDRKEEFYDPARKDNNFGKKHNAIGVVGTAPQRPNCGPGQSPKVRGRSALKVSARALGERCVPQWLMMASEAWERSQSGRAFGPSWMRWILCVCAQCQWSGICQ